MRGHHAEDALSHLPFGSIPADAGAPIRVRSPPSVSRVYPRGCGGTRGRGGSALHRLGLSPRMRGHHYRLMDWAREWRSIPADAGAPSCRIRTTAPHRVYPRGCGGTPTPSTGHGSVPGLSPRMRGHPGPQRGLCAGPGSIPADAGAPLLQFVRNRALRALHSVYRSIRATVCHRANQNCGTRLRRPSRSKHRKRSEKSQRQ